MPRSTWNGAESQDGYEISVKFGASGGVIERSEPDDSEASETAEFSRFESLTRRLVAVPKQEIDAERPG